MRIEKINLDPDEVLIWKYSLADNMATVNLAYERLANAFPNNTVLALPEKNELAALPKGELLMALKDAVAFLESEDEI